VGQASPYRSRQFLLLFAIALLAHFSNQILSFSLPNYAYTLGVSSRAVGILSGIYALCALFLRPMTGQIIDNENHLATLRLLLCLLLSAAVLLSFSDKYRELVVLRGVYGLAWGLGATLCVSIAAGFFSPAAMAAGLGVFHLGQVAAQILGPAFALSIAERLGYQTLYRLNAGAVLLCLLISLFLGFDSGKQPKKKRSYSFRFRDVFFLPAVLPSALLLCNSIARGALTAFLSIFAGTLNVENIGLFFTLQAGVTLLLRPFLAKILRRFSERKVLFFCEILEGAALLVVAVSRSLWQFLLAAVLLGASFAGSQPILTAECVKFAPPEKRGRASNTCYAGMDIGVFLGSNLSGFLVTAVGYRLNFLLLILPLAACSTVFFLLRRRKERG